MKPHAHVLTSLLLMAGVLAQANDRLTVQPHTIASLASPARHQNAAVSPRPIDWPGNEWVLQTRIAADLPESQVQGDDRGYITDEERNRIVLWTTGVGVAGITIWGVINWDYFSSRPFAEDEGWFGYNRKHGGADKLGHAYTSYVTTHVFAALYERWNFNPEDAAVYGTFTSFVVMSYMEFGDSFSENHGFSVEDFLINTVGCGLGYLTWRYPELARKVDFRMEYGFDPHDPDISTDYENSKYLMAIKLNGWDVFQDSYLRHLEFHVGYYTRGYNDDDEDDTDRERVFYMGIGINITDFIRRRGYRKTAAFFRYFQPPYTYHPYEWSYDH